MSASLWLTLEGAPSSEVVTLAMAGPDADDIARRYDRRPSHPAGPPPGTPRTWRERLRAVLRPAPPW